MIFCIFARNLRLKTLNMFKRILTLAVVATLAWGAQAKVKLSHLVGDNMVIQQQTDVRLWGWAKPNSTVTATTSWSQQKSTAKAGKDGQFLLTVKSPKASYTPLSITFDDGEGAVTINNVLAGEVWVCAGQSNMEMPVKGFGMCPVKGYNHHVLDAINSKGVRSIKIPSVMSSKPLNDAQAEWRVCSPKTVGEFSATGYFFARLLSRTLGIPVGIIEANKGGSRVESWLTKENLETEGYREGYHLLSGLFECGRSGRPVLSAHEVARRTVALAVRTG